MIKISQLWKSASKELSRRTSQHNLSEFSEFRELFLLSPNSLLEFQKVKKWRQKNFPRKKGRPPTGYESHQSFYNRYKLEFQMLLDPLNSLGKMPIKETLGGISND
ncbi:hypothetical protein OL234_00870 [Vagococcus intermedius]|uniref:Uncharacterized protein n=1 Tax=Vagococcus intermedius TaxID=2991418 RepID=A0AAF0CVI4_9ENTE|nr:hypothetical protein [Vagococcus intermedius]WEG73492.1 hypothetical protein OL234_00870 [Vagococcus intermedius]